MAVAGIWKLVTGFSKVRTLPYTNLHPPTHPPNYDFAFSPLLNVTSKVRIFHRKNIATHLFRDFLKLSFPNIRGILRSFS